MTCLELNKVLISLENKKKIPTNSKSTSIKLEHSKIKIKKIKDISKIPYKESEVN